MNEKIKEIIENPPQINRYRNNIWNGDVEFDYSEIDVTAFANALVKAAVAACVDVIETHHIPVGNSAAGELACEWTYDALVEIRDAINERLDEFIDAQSGIHA